MSVRYQTTGESVVLHREPCSPSAPLPLVLSWSGSVAEPPQGLDVVQDVSEGGFLLQCNRVTEEAGTGSGPTDRLCYRVHLLQYWIQT